MYKIISLVEILGNSQHMYQISSEGYKYVENPNDRLKVVVYHPNKSFELPVQKLRQLGFILESQSGDYYTFSE